MQPTELRGTRSECADYGVAKVAIVGKPLNPAEVRTWNPALNVSESQLGRALREFVPDRSVP